MAGLHQSPHLGVSTDFAEHRPYMPGDDVRHIDWRLYGRTDRLYVKEFEAETHADTLLLIDISASMSYGSGELTKLDYARYLAACLAYFSSRQRDRVGLVAFDRDVVDQVPASGRRLDSVLEAGPEGADGRRQVEGIEQGEQAQGPGHESEAGEQGEIEEIGGEQRLAGD